MINSYDEYGERKDERAKKLIDRLPFGIVLLLKANRYILWTTLCILQAYSIDWKLVAYSAVRLTNIIRL